MLYIGRKISFNNNISDIFPVFTIDKVEICGYYSTCFKFWKRVWNELERIDCDEMFREENHFSVVWKRFLKFQN